MSQNKPMKQSEKLGYMNCKYRAIKVYQPKDGSKKRVWGKCNKNGKSCREWDMVGFDCYEVREEDLV